MTGYKNVDFIVHGAPIITPITDSLIHKSNTKETLVGSLCKYLAIWLPAP
jgi:hypothetical protein